MIKSAIARLNNPNHANVIKTALWMQKCSKDGRFSGIHAKFTACWAISLVFLAGLVSSVAHANEPIKVLASIKPVHSIVSAVMKGVGEPSLIITGNESPHTFSLRPTDAKLIQDADLIFIVDEELEVSLADPIKTIAQNAQVIQLSTAEGMIRKPFRERILIEPHHEGEEHEEEHAEEEHADEHAEEEHADEHAEEEHADEHAEEEHADEHAEEEHADEHAEEEHADEHAEEEHGHAHGTGDVDLHFWLDPVNGVAMANLIKDALAQADPENAAVYAANANEFSNQIEQLMPKLEEKLKSLGEKTFIVFHDAYQYFEDRFGLSAAGSIHISPERPSGIRHISDLRDIVEEYRIDCVLAEPQFNRRLVDVITEGLTETRVSVIDPLGSTVEDGPNLYFELIENLADTFSECLTVPSS